jgi:uncharacterized protein (DUF2236 family)
MYPGGIAALLLQSLHPAAMSAVAGHSGYRSDPWGRLQRTADYLAATTFGTVDIAEAAIDKVRSIHQRVRGRDDLGRPYRADDPHLLRWVGTAEAYAFLTAFQTLGPDALTVAEADQYVAQAASVAERLGATGMPTSVAAMEDTLAEYRPELASIPATKEAARFLLREPPVPVLARPGYGMLAAGAVALLPNWARRELDLPLPGPARGLAESVGRAGTTVVRWGLAGLSDEKARNRHRGARPAA